MNNKKKFLILVLIIIVIATILTATIILIKNPSEEEPFEPLVEYNEDTGSGKNISKKFSETKNFENFSLYNSSLTFSAGTIKNSGVTKFDVTVKNNGDKDSKKRDIAVEFLDSNGEIVYSVAILLKSLKPNEETVLTASLQGDYINIYDYSIKNFEE